MEKTAIVSCKNPKEVIVRERTIDEQKAVQESRKQQKEKKEQS